jgi:hypothetical protein
MSEPRSDDSDGRWTAIASDIGGGIGSLDSLLAVVDGFAAPPNIGEAEAF